MLSSAVLFTALVGSSFAVDGEYLSNFDLIWNRTPKAYEESAFLGNGELGTCIWSARDETLHFDIGDTRVYSEKSFSLSNVNDFSDPKTYAALMGMDLVKNLTPEERGDVDGIQYRYVPLKGGQGYVLTWQFTKTAPGRYLLAWTTDYSRDAASLSKTTGIETIRNALRARIDSILNDHEAYWSDYFSKPFLSLPDKRMEANYWIQMYKYGSATRPGALPIDLMGPWFRATPWPRIWANLNVQLSYLPMAVGNQPGIATTLADWIDASHDIFIQAVDKKYQHDSASCGRGTSPYGPTGFWGEYGNFLWTLYDYWHFLRVYPDDADTTRYKTTLNKLVPKHVGEDGIMLGKDLPLTGPHRHYSHLVGLYPLRRIDIDNPEERALYRKTVDHWLGFKLDQPLTRHSWSYKGYSRTGAAPMYAMLDEPEQALDQLQQYFDLYLYPNTFYLETGPVIETPLSSAAATQELLLQSWGIDNYSIDLIRLFPGVAASWPEARFDGLRAEGGYTVGAVWKAGKTQTFKITADRERSLQLRYRGGEPGEIETTQGSPWKHAEKNGWQVINVRLQAGESLIYGPADECKTRVSDARTGGVKFHFGLNRQSDQVLNLKDD